MLACRNDPGCPYHDVLALSNPDGSNPDGLPAALQTIGDEMAPGVASTDWIGPTGVWGEAYADADSNGRFDDGESFTDDLANSSPVVGAGTMSTLGDANPPTSGRRVHRRVRHDRIAQGAFDPIRARVLYPPRHADQHVDRVGHARLRRLLLGFRRAHSGPAAGRARRRPHHAHPHPRSRVGRQVGLWGKDLTTTARIRARRSTSRPRSPRRSRPPPRTHNRRDSGSARSIRARASSRRAATPRT